MTAQQDPYVRVYYRVIDDPKFAGVFDDDARLACWLRLLLVADGTWPAPAPIPANVRRAPFQHLVDVGLVDVLPGGRYRIHGMDSERGERRARAQKAANTRHSGSSAGAMQAHSGSTAGAKRRADDTNMHSAPIRSEPNHSEPAKRARAGSDGAWDVALLISELTGYTPSPKVTEDIRADVANVGVERVAAAVRETHAAGGPFDGSTLFYAAHRLLFPMAEAERLTPRERRDRENADLAARIRAEAAAAARAQA